MSLIVIVGGQFGSEGKGKVTAYLSRKYDNVCVVRCGGPNSGHSINFHGKKLILRHIPCGIVNPNTKLYLAVGSVINVDVLLEEIKLLNLGPDRLKIDRNCVILDDNDINMEKQSKFYEQIGSTCSGTGAAVIKRILRSPNTKLAKDVPELSNYITNVAEELNSLIKTHAIIIEGTQGFGLSLYHSPYYPFATSRDTTAAGFLSEVGLSPRLVADIVMVLRTFPIRVGGNSGPLPNEIDWETVTKESGYPYKVEEYTSVTKRLRRVARFDMELVKKAVMINRPTKIVLMGLDYLSYKNYKAKSFDDLTENAKKLIERIENETGVKVFLAGTGPDSDDLIELE